MVASLPGSRCARGRAAACSSQVAWPRLQDAARCGARSSARSRPTPRATGGPAPRDAWRRASSRRRRRCRRRSASGPHPIHIAKRDVSRTRTTVRRLCGQRPPVRAASPTSPWPASTTPFRHRRRTDYSGSWRSPTLPRDERPLPASTPRRGRKTIAVATRQMVRHWLSSGRLALTGRLAAVLGPPIFIAGLSWSMRFLRFLPGSRVISAVRGQPSPGSRHWARCGA